MDTRMITTTMRIPFAYAGRSPKKSDANARSRAAGTAGRGSCCAAHLETAENPVRSRPARLGIHRTALDLPPAIVRRLGSPPDEAPMRLVVFGQHHRPALVVLREGLPDAVRGMAGQTHLARIVGNCQPILHEALRFCSGSEENEEISARVVNCNPAGERRGNWHPWESLDCDRPGSVRLVLAQSIGATVNGCQ